MTGGTRSPSTSGSSASGPGDGFETASGGGPRASRRLLIGVVTAIVTLGVLAVAAVAVGFFRSVEDAAARLVPAESPVYVSVLLDPSGSQKLALRDVIGRFPLDTGEAEGPADVLATLLDAQLDDIGLDYESDIRPWLGRQLALFLLPPAQSDSDGDVAPDPLSGVEEGAVLLATSDPAATRSAVAKLLEAQDVSDVEERTHGDVTYSVVGDADETAYAIVSEHLVVGTEEGVRRVIETAGGEDALGDAERFEDTVADLPEDHLVRYYVDSAVFVEVASSAGIGAFGDLDAEDIEPTAGVLLVRPDGVLFDSLSALSGDSAYRPLLDSLMSGTPVPDLPADAWFAFGLGDLGATAAAYLDFFADTAPEDVRDMEADFRAQTGLDLREDVLAWMESAGLFVRGRDLVSVRGAFVVESGDANASDGFLDEVRGLLEDQGVSTVDAEVGGRSGFRVQPPGLPVPLLAVGGDEIVVGVGEEAVQDTVDPDETLSDSESFRLAREALAGADPNVYLEIQAVVDLVESSIAGMGGLPSTYTEDVKPYLEPLGVLASATSADNERVRQRIFIGVPGGDSD